MEASRARKYKKGFAVVVEEFRGFAVKRTDSVRETSRIV